MLILLIAIIALNVLISFWYYKTLIAPPCLFEIGFLCSSIVAFIYRKEWDLGLHLNTFFVLCSGITVFTIVSIITNHILKRNRKHVKNIKTYVIINSKKYYWKLFFIVLFQVVMYYLVAKQVTSITSSQSLSSALNEIDQVSKYETSKHYDTSWLLGNFYYLCRCIGYLFAYILGKSIFDKKTCKTKKILYLCIVILSIFGELLTGTRGGVVQIIITFFIVAYIFYKKKYAWKTKISLKKLFLYASIFALLILSFQLSSILLGRMSSGKIQPEYYMAVYCGAEIKNLDIYINENHGESKLFGEATFNTLLGTKASQLKLLKFRFIGNYFLGNVYTTFQAFLQDFGYCGVVVLVSIMAILMQYLYFDVRNTNNINLRLFDFKFFLYSFLSPNLIFSFFGNRFYSYVIDYGFIKGIFLIFLISWFLESNHYMTKYKSKA